MWFQLKIEHCPVEDSEQISDELENAGALSIMLTDKNDNPVLEPEPGTTPLWPEIIIESLFAQAECAQAMKEQLGQTRPALTCSIEVLPEKDWERAWMDDFKPQRFGARLWICPTWLTPPEPEAVNLMLDPGLAFGTGTHPTTALCLTWLESTDLAQKTVIDYGCGSGILSLAALKLGACSVHAVDIDPQALQATHNNASSNDIAHNLSVSLPEELTQPADLMIANILLGPLTSLKERFYGLLQPGSTLVVSGLLAEQAAELIASYSGLFEIVTSKEMDGWALVAFTRQ